MDSELPPTPAPPAAPEPPRGAPGHPIAFFAALVVLYVLPGATAQVISPALGLAWTQLFVFLLPAVVSAAGSNLLPARALLLDRRPPRGTLAVALLAGVVGFVVAGSTMALVSSALPREWVKAFDLAPLFRGPPLERLALAAIAGVLAPLCEEAAFRGHLQTLLGARLRPGLAIALAAFLFAALHLDPVRFVAVLELGLVFGWFAWRAGSLWPAVVAHAANNTIAAVLVTASGAEAAAGAGPQPRAALAALAFGLVLLLPLLALYRHLTPAPPPLAAALVLADSADPDLGFRPGRVPRWLVGLIWVGAALLIALALWARATGRLPRVG